MSTSLIVGLIISGIVGVISFFISILASASNYVMMIMIDGSLLRFSDTGNLLEILETVFGKNSGLNWVNDTFGMNNFNLAGFIMEASIALITIIVVLDVISSLFNSIQGQPAENPVKIIVRGVITVALEFVIFGNPFNNIGWFNSKGLLYYFGEFANNLLVPVSQNLSKIDVALSAINIPLTFDVAQSVALIALSFSLFKGAMEAGIVYVERWLTFALTILFGPLAVAFNASEKTSKSFGDWFMSLVSHLLTIMVTIIVFRMYSASLLQLSGVATATGITDPFGIFKNLVFNFALSLALLTLFKHSEQILNSVGIRTIATSKTASAYRAGMTSFGRLVSMATRPMALAMGRNISGDLFHNLYQSARHNYGDNNWITKGMKYLDISDNNKGLDGKGLKISNGRFVNTSNTGGLYQNNQMATAQKSVNSAFSLKDGIGNVVSMAHVSMVSGISHMEGLNVSAVGKTAMAISKDENGNPVKNNAILFSATRTINGVESAPKMHAMVLSPNRLEGGNKLVSDRSYDGKYSISSNNAIPLRDGQGYIYEVNAQTPKMLSKSEFANTPSVNSSFKVDGNPVSSAEFMSDTKLQKEYGTYENYKDSLALDAKYNQYQEAHNNTMLLREEDDRLFNSQGYFPTWKAGTEFMGSELDDYIDSATTIIHEDDFKNDNSIENYWYKSTDGELDQSLSQYEEYIPVEQNDTIDKTEDELNEMLTLNEMYQADDFNHYDDDNKDMPINDSDEKRKK